MKKIFKTILPIVGKFAKGAIKSVPFGNVIVDGIENVTKKDLVDGSVEGGHDKLVWIAEIVCLIGVVGYLVHKDILTAQVLIDLVNSVIAHL